MFKNEECLSRNYEMNNNMYENEINMGGMQMMDYQNMEMGGFGGMHRPVYSPVQQRCVHKTIVHEVPHVCPIHTKVINHHVYKHTYRPAYSCSEENTCTNVQCGSCCQFR